MSHTLTLYLGGRLSRGVILTLTISLSPRALWRAAASPPTSPPPGPRGGFPRFIPPRASEIFLASVDLGPCVCSYVTYLAYLYLFIYRPTSTTVYDTYVPACINNMISTHMLYTQHHDTCACVCCSTSRVLLIQVEIHWSMCVSPCTLAAATNGWFRASSEFARVSESLSST